MKAKEPERFRLDLDKDREFDGDSSQVPSSSDLPPIVLPPRGPTLPEIEASDADEP